jgi:peroxiredoxin
MPEAHYEYFRAMNLKMIPTKSVCTLQPFAFLVGLLLLSTICAIISCGETPERFSVKNLHKLTTAEKDSRTIRLNNSIPSYTADGFRIKPHDWGKYLSDNNLSQDLYVDSTGVIKVLVFRKKDSVVETIRADTAIAPENAVRDDTGKQAVDFNVTDMDGNKITLAALKGKVVVLNLWFIACKPCVAEMGALNKVRDTYKGKDVVFIGLTFDDKPAVSKFLHTTSFNYTVVPAANAMLHAWDISVFPTNVVIDKTGTIQFYEYGFKDSIAQKLTAAIDKLR